MAASTGALRRAWRAPLTAAFPARSTAALRLALQGLRRHVGLLPAEAAYLIPLRAFLGMGWLRAAVEKLGDPGWQDGTALRLFIGEQEAGGLVLPFYEPVLAAVERLAAPVGVGVMLTEMAIGLAVLGGIRTTTALTGAIFLNVNFIMAGETNPSVFYVLIALVLLASGAGALLGWEGLRSAPEGCAAGSAGTRSPRLARRGMPVAAGGSLLMIPFITTTSPALVIHDPAAVLALLLGLVAFSLAIRGAQRPAPASGGGGAPPLAAEVAATREPVR